VLSCEIVITDDTSQRGKRMLRALEFKAPPDMRVVTNAAYSGSCDWLMLFGMGEHRRNAMCEAHSSKGRRIVVWDLGYWDRLTSLRVSVDHQHPWRWIYRMPIIEGRGHPAQLRDDYDANGPILFAGMGHKSHRQLGSEWDSNKLRELKRSGVDVRVRNKPTREKHKVLPPIADALRGCSKVVTHHSNVAVDGIVAGIPHDVADGAAKALKPTRDPVMRREFLDRLGSWQWSADEAPEIWKFLRSIPEHE
jgi:hypothetical protein